VAQLLEDARLTVEALPMLALVTAVKDLDCDRAAGVEILRTVNGRHAAGAYTPLDLEAFRDDRARVQAR
jgi:hypothetical protein